MRLQVFSGTAFCKKLWHLDRQDLIQICSRIEGSYDATFHQSTDWASGVIFCDCLVGK
jgi:hypothetical protein